MAFQWPGPAATLIIIIMHPEVDHTLSIIITSTTVIMVWRIVRKLDEHLMLSVSNCYIKRGQKASKSCFFNRINWFYYPQ